METFKNMIIGFINAPKADQFLDDFKGKVKSDNHTGYILDKDKAIDIFSPEGEHGSLSEKVKRFFQKHIGGGPSEFIRDLEEMNDKTRLVVIETEKLDKDQIETTRELTAQYNLVQAKHFGAYSVEHLSHSKEQDHRAEME